MFRGPLIKYKGKRGGWGRAGSAGGRSKRRRVTTGQKGYVRVGGYYGRYSGGNAEMKFLDNVVAAEASAQAGTLHSTSLVVIPEGNGENERIGRKLNIKKIQLRGSIQIPSTTVVTTAHNRVRIVLYQDTQTNGAAATVLGVLETATVDSFRNLANSGRFKVLYDKVFNMNFTAGNGTGMAEKILSYSFFKSCNIPIEYDNSATTGAITTQRSNNIGIFSIMESATPAAMVSVQCRMRYSDR